LRGSTAIQPDAVTALEVVKVPLFQTRNLPVIRAGKSGIQASSGPSKGSPIDAAYSAAHLEMFGLDKLDLDIALAPLRGRLDCELVDLFMVVCLVNAPIRQKAPQDPLFTGGHGKTSMKIYLKLIEEEKEFGLDRRLGLSDQFNYNKDPSTRGLQLCLIIVTPT